MDDTLAWIDATETARLVAASAISASEVVDSAIERAEALDPQLGFLVERCYDAARRTAASSPPDGGPLAGVPMLVKDHLATLAGVRHTSGSRFLSDHVATHDSELVTRYRRQGLIPIGTTRTSELALLSTGESALHGPCRNPWNPRLVAGGSSGGSAVGVAAGVVPVAHGNDAGGSIRIPAGACGLFGLKPTRARNPSGPDFGDVVGGLWAEHVLTRSVRDSARILDLTAGPGLGDPYAVTGGAGSPGQFSAAIERDPSRLRIVVSTRTPTGGSASAACERAVAETAALCESLGHVVEAGELPLDLASLDEAFATVYAAGAAWTLDSWRRRLGRDPSPGDLEPFTLGLAERGRSIDAAEYLLAVEHLQASARRVAHWHLDHDLLLTPTTSTSPPPLRTFSTTAPDPSSTLEVDSRYAAYTWVANATGQPAMSVPLSWNEQGVPIGSHFQAAMGREDLLLALAAQLERARPWVSFRPPTPR